MSVTFNGTKKDPSVSWGTRMVRTSDEAAEDSVGFNLNNGNARSFLLLLEIDERDLCGSRSMPDMVRAVQRARASFDYRVDALTRKASQGAGERGCRWFSGGVDAEYFERRLTEFSELLADWIELGADAVSWG